MLDISEAKKASPAFSISPLGIIACAAAHSKLDHNSYLLRIFVCRVTAVFSLHIFALFTFAHWTCPNWQFLRILLIISMHLISRFRSADVCALLLIRFNLNTDYIFGILMANQYVVHCERTKIGSARRQMRCSSDRNTCKTHVHVHSDTCNIHFFPYHFGVDEWNVLCISTPPLTLHRIHNIITRSITLI